jgi:hypothetical protein
MRLAFALMLRSVAAQSLRRVSKHEGASGWVGADRALRYARTQRRARSSGRGRNESGASVADEVIE